MQIEITGCIQDTKILLFFNIPKKMTRIIHAKLLRGLGCRISRRVAKKLRGVKLLSLCGHRGFA